MTTALQYSGATDEGNKRDHNEDAFFADGSLGLWFIADGMGGHESGEVASTIVKEQVSESVRNGAKLTDAIQDAHHSILRAGQEGIGTVGMGSTIVAVQVKGSEYEVAWVGDSRAYLWDGKLKQLSHDHSIVQELLDNGLISPEEATNHPHRHIITQSLGYVNLQDVHVDHVAGQLLHGQKILLCSDGLNDEVSEEQISDIINSKDSESAIVDDLISAALINGGNDNVTVLLISAPEDAPDEYTENLAAPNEPGNIYKTLSEYVHVHKQQTFIILLIIAVLSGLFLFK
jgi:protein phosphatase